MYSARGLVYRKLDSAYKILRSEGIGEVLRETLRKVGIIETYLAYGINLQKPIPNVRSEVPIVVRRATANDFMEFQKMPLPFCRHAEIHEKYGLGQCYLGMITSEIAHLAWIYYPKEQHLHPTHFLKLRPDEAQVANLITVNRFRGKGVYPSVMNILLHKLQDEGYHYVYVFIENDNVASRRGITKLGFRVIGRSWRIRFFYHFRRDPAAGIYIHGPCSRRKLNQE